jgi:hypothetical protein
VGGEALGFYSEAPISPLAPTVTLVFVIFDLCLGPSVQSGLSGSVLSARWGVGCSRAW